MVFSAGRTAVRPYNAAASAGARGGRAKQSPPEATRTVNEGTGKAPTIIGIARNVFFLGWVSFLTDISSEMSLSMLPLFMANVLGVRTTIIGLVEGVAETTAALTRIPAGWLSDLWGKRKSLTLIGYALSSFSKPFLYVADSWTTVFGVRFADRLGKGVRTAPRDALIADSTAEGRRGLSFGFHRAADTAGAMLGLLGMALIIWLTQRGDLHLHRPAYQTIVLVAIIPGLLGVLVLWLCVGESARPRRPDAKPPSLSLRGFDRRFKLYILIVLLFTLGNSSDAFLVLRAQNLGMSALLVALLLVVFNATKTVVATPAGALSDRLGRRAVIAFGWTFYAIIYLGFAVAHGPHTTWLLFALYGVYGGAAEGTERALVADMVRAEERGTAYGVYNAAVGVTLLPASLIAGVLWQGAWGWTGLGPSAPFYFGAAMAFVAVILLLVLLRGEGKSERAA